MHIKIDERFLAAIRASVVGIVHELPFEQVLSIQLGPSASKRATLQSEDAAAIVFASLAWMFDRNTKAIGLVIKEFQNIKNAPYIASNHDISKTIFAQVAGSSILAIASSWEFEHVFVSFYECLAIDKHELPADRTAMAFFATFNVLGLPSNNINKVIEHLKVFQNLDLERSLNDVNTGIESAFFRSKTTNREHTTRHEE